MRNRLCNKFSGRNTCDYFISTGGCRLQGKFMCHVFKQTGSQPIEDDVPLYIGEVLKVFPEARVVKEINPEPRGKQKKMEEFLGKLNF